MATKYVIHQSPFKSSPRMWWRQETDKNTQWELQRSQMSDQSTVILPACSARRVSCTEDGSVWPWSAFSAGNSPLERNNRFVFLFLCPLITKLMYCHTWLMCSVAYQSPWSICEHFNSNMENCMSKYQRLMPWALAFSAERGYSFWAGNTSLQR